MKSIGYILLFLLPMMLMGQETAESKKAAKDFMTYYNEGKSHALYAKFDTVMKSHLPVPKIDEFYSALTSQFGKITGMEYLKNVDRSYHYKTTFDKGVLKFVVAVGEDGLIYGLIFQQYVPDNLPNLTRNSTSMKLPFNEEWTVFWGGETIEQNYHVAYNNQKYAYDFVMMKEGKTYEGDPKNAENYYAFGKEVIAPCDATVVEVISGVKDNVPGEMNPAELTGNTVILKTENNEYILLAHLKFNSIVVEEGQQVKTGEPLGQCGNSGNTTEPHLHVSLQNVQDMSIATGAKLYFDNIIVNGEVKTAYIPVKNDLIKNR
ncbi:peptidoglycan DD-metalloendopeptidase family protein [Flavobacteriaceae bacterium F08102]|nr:peptidoglycan DD-metalloendopeptidase family protein [Flavobacteriaceae bacterium F08102]